MEAISQLVFQIITTATHDIEKLNEFEKRKIFP